MNETPIERADRIIREYNLPRNYNPMNTTRYTLRMFYDDMGSFTQPGCTSKDDALWHINSARDHDGLRPIDMDKLEELLSNQGPNKARLTPEN